jgi:hypothetical protein
MMVWMGVYSQSFLPPVGKITASILEQTNVNVPYRVQDRHTPVLVGRTPWSAADPPVGQAARSAAAPLPTEVADAR